MNNPHIVSSPAYLCAKHTCRLVLPICNWFIPYLLRFSIQCTSFFQFKAGGEDSRQCSSMSAEEPTVGKIFTTRAVVMHEPLLPHRLCVKSMLPFLITYW